MLDFNKIWQTADDDDDDDEDEDEDVYYLKHRH